MTNRDDLSPSPATHKPLSVQPGAPTSTVEWLLEVMPGPEWFKEQLIATGMEGDCRSAGMIGNHIRGNLLQMLQAMAEKDA